MIDLTDDLDRLVGEQQIVEIYAHFRKEFGRRIRSGVPPEHIVKPLAYLVAEITLVGSGVSAGHEQIMKLFDEMQAVAIAHVTEARKR